MVFSTLSREWIPHKRYEGYADAVRFSLHCTCGRCLPGTYICSWERISFWPIHLLCCQYQCSWASKVPEQKIPSVQSPNWVSPLSKLLNHILTHFVGLNQVRNEKEFAYIYLPHIKCSIHYCIPIKSLPKGILTVRTHPNHRKFVPTEWDQESLLSMPSRYDGE